MKPNYTLVAFVIGSTLVYAASKLGVSSVWIYVADVKESFELSDSEISFWSSISRSPFAYLFGVLLAYIGDRFGRARMLYLSVAVLICWLMAASLISSPTLRLISYFLLVSFSVTILPLVFSLVYAGTKRCAIATIIGLVASTELLIVLIGMQVSGFTDWSTLLRVLAGVALSGGLIMTLCGFGSLSRESGKTPNSSNASTIWLLLLAVTLAFSALYALSSWSYVLILRSTEETASELGRWALIPLMGIFLGRIVGGMLTDWRVKQTHSAELMSALIGSCVMTLGLLGLIWGSSLVPLVGISAIVAFGGGLVYSPTVALVLRLSNPRLFATNVAMVLFAINLGLLLGPLLTGFVSDYYYHNGGSVGGESLRKALAWLSIPAFLAMSLFALVSKRGRPTKSN